MPAICYMPQSNLLFVAWQQLTSSGDLSYLGAQWRRDVAFAGYNIALQVSHLMSRIFSLMNSHVACARPMSAAWLAVVCKQQLSGTEDNVSLTYNASIPS